MLGGGSNDDDQVECPFKPERGFAVGGLNPATLPISLNVGADLPGGRETHEPGSRQAHYGEKLSSEPLALGENLFETTLAGTYEEIFFRPLRRRRFSVFCPSVVFIRMRKP